ncbi:MAG: DUF2306 domain-containing protein [Saprospiraceae bacterium]
MDYHQLMYIHLATIIPCFFLGAYLLLTKKGTTFHKKAGWIYMVLMMFTGILTLFMPAKVGPTFASHFGYIHLLSLLTIYTVPSAIIAARKGNIKRHKRGMLILYFGGLLVAGGFTFFPGRYLHTIFFGG